ncbi:MAG: hypothetical protein ACPHF4_05950 [Rubripirellula sp.]
MKGTDKANEQPLAEPATTRDAVSTLNQGLEPIVRTTTIQISGKQTPRHLSERNAISTWAWGSRKATLQADQDFN